MRSIRLSLMVYFLGLLTVALGVALLLVYQTAQRHLGTGGFGFIRWSPRAAP